MCALCEGAGIEVGRNISEFGGTPGGCPVKLTAGLRIAAQVLLFAFQSQTTLKAAPPARAAVQHFVCDGGYSLTRCQVDMAVLRKILAKYRAAELGEWTCVLVRSADWKYFVTPRGMDPDRPHTLGSGLSKGRL